MSNIFLPVSINITDKQIAIIGGGRLAFHKASILSQFTKKVIVIAPKILRKFKFLPFELKNKSYEIADLENIFLVYICTEKKMLNSQIQLDCKKFNILTCLCNNSSKCDFISPAIYKNDQITISVSSNAQNVLQSIDIRNQISKLVQKNILKITLY